MDMKLVYCTRMPASKMHGDGNMAWAMFTKA